MKDPVASYGAVIVLTHLLINLVHGAARSRLHIGLSAVGSLFVGVVILVCPLLAMALVWAKERKAGLDLLAVSMTASLIFGTCHHFAVAGIDRVGQQGSGEWAATFTITAWLLAITEAAGVLFALCFLAREAPATGR